MRFSIGDRSYDGERPLVMGILNVTPDSFFDGGRYDTTDAAVARACAMVGEGADIIDIGGESSRPGAGPVSAEDEIARVIPVVEAVAGKVTVPISVDTTKPAVAREAVRCGATVVNDITAMGADTDMAAVIASSDASVILMHMQGEPRTMQKNPAYDDPVDDILSFLQRRVEAAGVAGIPRERIIVDPGIGFGKTLTHNLAILRDIRRFHETGCAICLGVSNKSMFGKLTGADPGMRVWGTAAVSAVAVYEGVEIHRVHDVAAIRQVVDTAAALRAGNPRPAGERIWN